MCNTQYHVTLKKKKIKKISIVTRSIVLGSNSHSFISLPPEVICQHGIIFFTLINEGKKKREGDDENTDFSPAWEIKFALAEIRERPACLIRQKTIAVSKQANLQRHHKQLYAAFEDGYAPDGYQDHYF